MVTSKIDHVIVNGDREKRLPGNANTSFEFIEGESLLLSLDMVGIAASSGSACTSGSLDPSHVLLAIGLPHGIAHGSLRVTFSHLNTEEEVDQIVDNLVTIVKKIKRYVASLRGLSERKEGINMYSEKVMDHFSNPRNVGELENANAIGQVGNAKCGDIMKMYMRIEDDVIKDIKFKTFGCGAAVATSSMATELVKGKTVKRGFGAYKQGCC